MFQNEYLLKMPMYTCMIQTLLLIYPVGQMDMNKRGNVLQFTTKLHKVLSHHPVLDVPIWVDSVVQLCSIKTQ